MCIQPGSAIQKAKVGAFDKMARGCAVVSGAHAGHSNFLTLLRSCHSRQVQPRSTFLPTDRHSAPSGGRRKVVAMALQEQQQPAEPKRVVICGAGIIGASVAYYLAQRGVASTLVEREEVACAASGKAGGFLALDWNDSSPVGQLARLSYQMHADLAEVFGAEAIGYRQVTTLQVSATELAGPLKRRPAAGKGGDVLPSWVDGNVTSVGELGGPSTTAQVHPRLLTAALVEAAVAKGVRLVKAKVSGLKLAEGGGSITGVVLEGGEVLPADAAVLAMGPWTSEASAWLNGAVELGITGQKYHSLVLRPTEGSGTSAHCLFTSFKHASGRQVEPEVYPRPDGTVYVCGEPQATVPVPSSPSLVTVEPQLCENVRKVATSLSSSLSSAIVEVQQACYLPMPPDGLPVIGQVPGLDGVYVATGHSCWGILNGPATGKVVAELIVDNGVVSCLLPEGVEMLSPARLIPW